MKSRWASVSLTAVLVGAVFAAAPARSEDKAPLGGTICQGNTIYVVCVDDIDQIGRYTARTGSGHTVPERNLLFGGEGESPGTSFSSYRSFTSGTTYSQGDASLNAVATTSTIGTTGVRTTYDITAPDSVQVVQDVNVNGTTESNSNVEVTTRLTNTGTTGLSLGTRYLWDYQIGEDDGPTFRERNPDGPVRGVEAEFSPVSFEYYEIQDNEFDDPTTPLYTVLGSAAGPTSVTPQPVAPTQMTFASWPSSFGTAFDYTATGQNVAGPGGINDSAVLYWWGRNSSNALVVPPGQSVTVRALLFATLPGAPPPFDSTPPSCRVTARRAGPPAEIDITVRDTGSGLASIEVTRAENATVNVPPFAPGTTDPVVVTATKLNQAQRSRVGLRATDMNGNATRCTASGVISF